MSKMFVRKYDYDDDGTPMYAIIIWYRILIEYEWCLILDTITHNKQKRDDMFKQGNYFFDRLRGGIKQDPPNELCDVEIRNA